jgi:hypothetical protein
VREPGADDIDMDLLEEALDECGIAVRVIFTNTLDMKYRRVVFAAINEGLVKRVGYKMLVLNREMNRIDKEYNADS